MINLSFILLLGVVMVFSSSYILAKETFDSSTYFLQKQILFIIVGVAIALVVGKTKLSFWIKIGPWFHAFTTLLLSLTFIKEVGFEVKGASRWINLGFISFQPGELVKYSIIIASLPYFEFFETMTIKERMVKGLLLICPVVLLIMQPDFGSFTICIIVMIFVAFISRFRRIWFYGMVISGAIIGPLVLFSQSYRVQRILSYLDPWKNPKGSGFQIIQSYLGFANGSLFGKGLGNSTEKLFYLPEAHNDFILSVIGEELGFMGIMFLVILYLSFIYLSLRFVVNFQHRIAGMLGATVVFTVGIQAFLNMAVVLGLLPTKGLNLPFVSAGGSSMIANLFGIGLLMCAYRFIKSLNMEDDPQEDSSKFQ